jgi:3-deoxy-7-phosphoheptulonate synthase
VAVDAVRAAAVPHAFTGIDMNGTPSIVYTHGNRDCHVILRGGSDGPNYDSASVDRPVELLRGSGLPARVMIDLSHANSGKDAARQPVVAAQVAGQVGQGNRAVVGAMLESFLVLGRQERGEGQLTYGQSITDACLDWERTVGVLEQLAGAVRDRRCGSPS